MVKRALKYCDKEEQGNEFTEDTRNSKKIWKATKKLNEA